MSLYLLVLLRTADSQMFQGESHGETINDAVTDCIARIQPDIDGFTNDSYRLVAAWKVEGDTKAYTDRIFAGRGAVIKPWITRGIP